MLDPDQRQLLRAHIKALQDELGHSLQSMAEAGQTVELDQTRQGRLSRMDALQGQAMAQAAHARAAARLQSLRLALARLEDAGFGDCVECGEAIAFRRLQIDPCARYCIRCAEALE